MNEILWLDGDYFPYTVCSTGDLFWFKDRSRGVYLRTPLPVVSRGDSRIYLHYLNEGQTFDSELFVELDIGDDNNFN